MNDLLIERFGKPRVFLPVIHLPDGGRLGMAAVEVALQAGAPGADGVFLINQGTTTENIVESLVPALRREFGADLWIGVNPLGTQVEEFLPRSDVTPEHRIDGVWSDDAGVDAMHEEWYQHSKKAYLEARRETGWKGLYFGGTAFKTQLASGVTPENVDGFLPYVEAFLVATGIERDFGVLDPVRTRDLAEKIHGFGG